MNFKDDKQILIFPRRPNATRTLKQRISSFSFPFESSLKANDFWAILFIGCISLFVHKLALVIPVYVLLKTNRRRIINVIEFKRPPKEIEQIVQFIQMNHLQSLTEAIESNPLLLHYEYKKKDLLSWCKFYNNTKALMVIAQLNKKYPKEKSLSLAA